MNMNTATVGLAVTPTVLSTFVSHVCLPWTLEEMEIMGDEEEEMRRERIIRWKNKNLRTNERANMTRHHGLVSEP